MDDPKLDYIIKAFRIAFQPKPKLSMAEWCEKYITLDSLSTGTGGKYSLRNYHYLKGIYDSVENPYVRKVVVMKSVQSGLTTAAQNIILWYVCNKNVPITYFTATKDLAMRFSKGKLQPTIETLKPIQELRRKTSENKSLDRDKETISYFEFINCILRLGYAGSLSSLAGDPACLVVLDELSKWKDNTSEAKSVDLALARTTSFPLEKKQLLFSTPAEESTCVINREYKTGDERVFKVKSPYTNKFFEITLDCLQKPEVHTRPNGNYDWSKIERETYLCDPTTKEFDDNGNEIFKGKPIRESDKADLVRTGIWVATNDSPLDPTCHSFKVTALYSMDVSWGEIMKRWLQSLDDQDKLKELRTQFLGQTWTQKAATIRLEEIENIIHSSPYYMLGSIPETMEGGGMLLGAVDVQADRYYYVVQALAPSGNVFTIDYGILLSLEDVMKLKSKVFKTLDGKEELTCERWLIDEGGFSPAPIRDLCIQSGYAFTPCKGFDKISNDNPYVNTSIEYPVNSGTNIPYVKVNDPELKRQLLLIAIKYNNKNWYLPRNVSDDFKTQLTNEEYIESDGQYYWKTKGANHYLDVCKYCYALIIHNRIVLDKIKRDEELLKLESNGEEQIEAHG